MIAETQRVTLGGQRYLLAAARAAACSQRAMLSPANQWPLPGQVAPLLMPCAFCRRRLVVNGKQVFKSCSCQAFGPSVTVAALAAGALALLGSAWWLGRRKNDRKLA